MLRLSCCSYVAGLFASAHDSHSGVRKAVCAGLVQMLQLQPERLAPHMDQIIEYMLESTQVRTTPTFAQQLAVWFLLDLSRFR